MGGWVGGVVVGTTAPLSSSLDLHGNWSARLYDAAAVVENSFNEGRGQVRAGARYAYPGVIASVIAPDLSVGYWDYQLQSIYMLDSGSELQLLWFGAGDYLNQNLTTQAGTELDRELLKLSFHRLDARYTIPVKHGTLRLALTGGVDTSRLAENAESSGYLLAGRLRFDRRLTDNLTLGAGASVRFEQLDQSFNLAASNEPSALTPATFEGKGPEFGDPRYPLGFGERLDTTSGVYAALRWSVDQRVTLTPGLRLDAYSSGSQLIPVVEPRLNATYALTSAVDGALDLGVAHQRPSVGPPLPGFVPTLKGGLQRAYQSSATLDIDVAPSWDTNVTVFQHSLTNTTDYLGVPAPEDNPRSIGHAYGLELGSKKQFTNNWGASFSYTFTHATRSVNRFSGLAATNRSHVANVGLVYSLGAGWLASARALAYSGVLAESNTRDQLDKRTSPFWRVDWRLEKRWTWQSRSVALVAEVLNTTANAEPIGWDCNDDSCVEERVGPILVPNLGVSGKF